METSIKDLLKYLSPSELKEVDTLLGTYQIFRRSYRNAPAAFVRDCLVWHDFEGPTVYQCAILDCLAHTHRVAVRSPHGAGKTALASWAILWFALTRDGDIPWKVVCTASAWRQLTKYLMPELHLWTRRLNWQRIGRLPLGREELLALSLKLSTGEAFAVASQDEAFIEGAHSPSILYIMDEAKAIPGRFFDAIEGAFSGAGQDTHNEAFALVISTPGEPQGRFYDIHVRKPGYCDWATVHISLQDALGAGRISRDWVTARRAQWGERSAVYQNRVEGQFATSEETGVIPLAWIEAANERWHLIMESADAPHQINIVGVDVARGGEDSTVVALCCGLLVTELRYFVHTDTMATVGHVAGVLQRATSARAIIDVIGVGAGVYDRLWEQGYTVEPFNAAASTDFRDVSGELGFVNCRSAAWWHLRELLDPARGSGIALPPDDLLTGDLTAPRWRVTSGGRIQVEGKDDIRKRLGRSTDSGDAVMQALWSLVGEAVIPDDSWAADPYYGASPGPQHHRRNFENEQDRSHDYTEDTYADELDQAFQRGGGVTRYGGER